MEDDNVIENNGSNKSNVSRLLEGVTEVGDCEYRWVRVKVLVSENWVCGGIEYVGGLALSDVACRSKHTRHCYFLWC